MAALHPAAGNAVASCVARSADALLLVSVEPCNYLPAGLLRAHPRCAHTSARTVVDSASRPRVLELDAHIARLRTSLLCDFTPHSPFCALIDVNPAYFTSVIGSVLRCLVPSDAPPLMLTIVVLPDGNVMAHRMLMPPKPLVLPLSAACGYLQAATLLHRDVPAVKDAKYIAANEDAVAVAARFGIDDLLVLRTSASPPHGCRGIMPYEILEGTLSNFLVIDADGALVTAPYEDVQPNIILRLVLLAAREMGIPVRREAPRLACARSWRAACIANLSSLLLPVWRIDFFIDRETTERLELPEFCDTVAQLRERLQLKLVEHSQPLHESK